MNAARAARDLRALGRGAPVRAAYEASKRVGGHAAVFARLERRPGPTEPSRPVFPVRPVPGEAVERVRTAAEVIAGGHVQLFGQSITLGSDPDWHAVIDGAGSWPAVRWWTIDVRSPDRQGDVKWVWELGRHRHLVVLARAASTPDPDPRWSATLHDHLRSWLDQNPPEVGIHWASNLEISLRAVAWLEVMARLGDRLDPDVRASMDAHLHHAAAHLVADLPYTLSTMRNNHLLGDALGLVALGRAFAEERWLRLGTGLFRSATRRLVHADGSMDEDSLSYHRFVLELLAVRTVVGPAEPVVRDRMAAAARFLVRLGALDGPVPQYGDWDEGRAVTTTGDPDDLAGSIRLGLALAGHGAPASWRRQHDEVAWLTREGTPVEGDTAQCDGHDIGGGLARATAGPYTVWLKAGGGPSHGHADRTSTPVLAATRWVVGDPGTGAYNGDLDDRNFLRSSAAHSVLVLDDQDQLVPHRNFRWEHAATGRIGPPIRTPDALVVWGAHDAYRRLDPSRRVARVVVLHPGGVAVQDWIEGPPGIGYRLTLPIPPGPVPTDLVPPGDAEEVEEVEGSWSTTYGTIEPARRLVATGTLDGPVTWRVGDPAPELAVSVRFAARVVALTVGDQQAELVL